MSSQLSGKAISYCLRITSLLILFSAFTKIRLLSGLSSIQSLWAQFLVVLFFLSAVAGLIGIILQKMWGFLLLYFHIIIATFFFSASVIPLLFQYLNLDNKSATMLLPVINLVVLLLVAFLQVAASKVDRREK